MKPDKAIRRGMYLLPNLLTTFNLICGILALVLSLEPRQMTPALGGVYPPQWISAAWLILAAMIFDYLDGKVARWAKAASDFGMRIDSLTDLLSFGIAPMVLAYSALLAELPGLAAMAICGLYLLAGAWRLARFNLESSNGGHQTYFTGLPIPAAACFIASLVLVSSDRERMVPRILGHSFSALPPQLAGSLSALLLGGLAALMVSRIPFPAFKKVDQRNLILLGGVGIFAAVLLLVLQLQYIIFFIMLIYVTFGLFQSFVDRVIRLQSRRRSRT
jgi:CDP-diacylglycerol--serine O-phosphatidyltransferase